MMYNRSKRNKWLKKATTTAVSAVLLLSLTSCQFFPGPDSSSSSGELPAGLQEEMVNPFINTGTFGAGGKFYADYASVEEKNAAAVELGTEIGEEGNVLLKNADNVLPLGKNDRRVTLFGMGSISLYAAGVGSGGGSAGNGYGRVDTALEDSGFQVNPKTISLYEQYRSGGSELSMSNFKPAIVSSYYGYNDAAIITLRRQAGEAHDLETCDVEGHSDKNEHQLQLTDNERALIKHVKENFNKVVVLINSANIMQIPELAEKKTDENLGVDAILWVGTTGAYGMLGAAHILNGDVNPSGHTVDLWSKDFTKDPTFTNFGYSIQNVDEYGNRMDNSYYDSEGNKTQYTSVEYREDIYAGYRYYETVAAEKKAAGQDGEAWYQNSVLYPFGYGLSYTTFDWELDDEIAETATIKAANETVTLKVKVTNTGDVAGKDVVQIYYGAPYTAGGIEKSSTNLVAYAKTGLLEPGESEVVTIQFVAQDMASFDWSDANGNGFKGWELENGDYVISANRDSHTPVLSVTRTLKEDLKLDTDYETGVKIEPVYVDEYTTVNDALLTNKLSRTDLVNAPQPAVSTKEERTLSDEDLALLESEHTYDPYQDDVADPWYVEEVPEGWTQNESYEEDYSDVPVKLADMAGVAKDDVKWSTFMNQLTWEDMCSLVTQGTGAVAIPAIEKTADRSSDGPVAVSGGITYSGAPITAGTWNVDLAYQMGRMIGNDCIFSGVTEWLGPGMNTHRSPFSGRNFEYYSEDGVQAAYIAAAAVRGATDKGILTYIKHFYCNDQEEFRDVAGGICTWVTEQAQREIYVRPFEAAIKAGSMGLMSAFNRMGYNVTSSNYAMLTKMLREQFGFQGAVVTDAWLKDYAPINLMIRSGNDQVLGTGSSFEACDLTRGEWSVADNCVKVPANENEKSQNINSMVSPTQYYGVRMAAQNILYTRVNSVANRNGVSGLTFDIDVIQGASISSLLTTAEAYEISNIALAENAVLPEGLQLSDGVLSGSTNVEIGVYTVDLTFTADTWVANTTGKLNIHVVSPLRFNGENLDGGKIELNANEKFEVTVDDSLYTYGYRYGRAGSGWLVGRKQIVNWYYSEAAKAQIGNNVGYFNRNEDKTGADLTFNPDDYADVERHEYKFRLGEDAPSWITLENVPTTVNGSNGRDTYETCTTAKLSGTPTEAGEYTFTIEIEVPWACYLWGGLVIQYPGQVDPVGVDIISYTVTIVVS